MSLTIAIAGAGVAGTAAALALARAGHRVHLYEQAPTLLPVGAGLLLQPSGQAALARLNLLHEVVPGAHRIDTLHAHIHSPGAPRRTLIRLPYTEHSPTTHAFGVHRPLLFSALHRAALAAGVTLHLAHIPVATKLGPQTQRHLVFQDGSTSAPFDLIVAADGARSRLRQSSTLRQFTHTYAHTALWAIAPCRSVNHTLLQVTQGTQRLVGILPTGNGLCSFFFGLTPGELPRLQAAGFPNFRDTCLALAPESADCFSTLTDFSQFTHTPFHHVIMPAWHNHQNLVFIGDAAHAMSPHFGQGVNLALLDALALADAIQTGTDLPGALQTYEHTRRPHTRLYATLSLLLTPFFQGSGHVKAFARNLALPTMTAIPPVRRRMLHTMTGLRPSLTNLLAAPRRFP